MNVWLHIFVHMNEANACLNVSMIWSYEPVVLGAVASRLHRIFQETLVTYGLTEKSRISSYFPD